MGAVYAGVLELNVFWITKPIRNPESRGDGRDQAHAACVRRGSADRYVVPLAEE